MNVAGIVQFSLVAIFSVAMDHSPIRQTFELGKFISTAGKSIINLVKLRSLVAKYRKMWNIQSCEVCEFVHFCITRGKALPHFKMW